MDDLTKSYIDKIKIQAPNAQEIPKTCIHCLNSEPYVCDIIWCTEWKKPTHRLETCEKFRRMI